MKKILCIYHSADLDGHCSGAIIKYKFHDAVMYPMDHGDIINWDKIKKFDIVYICDFVLNPFSEMIKLENMKNIHLIWIDHHLSAINDSKNCIIKFFGIQKTGIGACELTWKYIFPNKQVPKCVKLLSQYDVWDHSHPDTLPFQYGMKAIGDTHPINKNMYKWNNVFLSDQKFIDKTCMDGEAIISYNNNFNRNMCNIQAFETVIDGYKAIACNRGLESSQMFKSIWDNKKYDIMISFYLSKNMHWFISLYTDKENINVGEIASRYGGGGHKQAAGMDLKKLPFNIKNN
jgi:oligoribonuclease NrnB/cAMP/cGMP phosphodiesterase (DHH superfamily)